MAIIDTNGRPRSVRTPEEKVEEVHEDFENLTDEEKAAFLAIASQMRAGNFRDYESLVSAEYERVPVDPRTFLLDDYYIGKIGANMWPKLQDDFVDLFTNGYSEAILGGCIDLDAIVFGADGSLHTLRERLGTSPWVTSVADTGEEASKSSGAVESGVRPVVQLTIANGASVKLTPDHKVRVWRGGYQWIAAKDLVEDDLVVVPRKWTPFSVTTISVEAAKLIAYFVGDGSVSETRARFCDGNPETSQEVLVLLRAIGFDGTRRPKGNAWEVHITKTKTSGFWDWACSHDLDLKTREVVVPRSVCISSNEVVAAFLNRLWACEGCVYAPSSGKSPPRFALGMTSERCVRQVQALLLRFGVRGRIFEIKPKGRSRLACWHLQVSGRDQLAAFLDAIGPILGKEGACERIAAYVAQTRGNTNVDVLPVTWGWLNDQMVERGIQRPAGNRWWMLATSRECHVSRQLFAQWLSDYGDTDLGGDLRFVFDDSVGFERVRGVNEVLAAIPTGDVTDAGDHRRFVANGISVSNSIGWGKSFFASCGLAYVIYQMSCLKDPQQVYGLAPGSSILVSLLSVTREVARRVPLAELNSKLEQSPYFKEQFPFKFASTMYEIRFPKRITVVGGSTSSSVLGGNVFAGFIDEVSYMGDERGVEGGRYVPVDKGAKLHTAITRRMKSRFQKVGKLPGVLFVVSSKERPVAFVEQRIKEVRETGDRSCFVREYATWDVKPEESFSDESFKIAVGNDRVRATLDPTPEQEAWYQDNGLQVIEVPDDYRTDFEHDLEGSLRDIAGIATEAISPFIHRVEKLAESITDLPSPLDIEEWQSGTPLEFHWNRVCEGFERRLPGGFKEQGWRPRRHPGAARYAHIDPALTGDAAGVCISHIAGWIEVIKRDSIGDEYTELAPVYETDLILAVKPPPGDEIFLGDLRAIVYQFAEHGFQIARGTLDSYQSADTIQQFRQRGIEAEVLSVDRKPDPYEVLKTAIYEGRMRLQKNDTLQRELHQLQRVPHGRSGKWKIDHPKRGSKDIADALCGVTFSLASHLPGQPLDPVRSSREAAPEDAQDHSWVTGGSVMVPPSARRGGARQSMVGPAKDGAPFPMPFVKG